MLLFGTSKKIPFPLKSGALLLRPSSFSLSESPGSQTNAASAICSPNDFYRPSARTEIASRGFLRAIIIYDGTAGESGCGHMSPSPQGARVTRAFPQPALTTPRQSPLERTTPRICQQVCVSNRSATNCSHRRLRQQQQQKRPFLGSGPTSPTALGHKQPDLGWERHRVTQSHSHRLMWKSKG